MAKTVEELKLFQRAEALCLAIDAILDRPGFQRSRRLREQLEDAADSMLSNIAEGFEQPTDRAFAHYLFISKASAAEARTRLKRACARGYITEAEFQERDGLANEVGRLAAGLISYLMRSNRTDRGLGRFRESEDRPDTDRQGRRRTTKRRRTPNRRTGTTKRTDD